MIDASTVIAVTAGAFIGTNLDNFVLLVALYSRYQKHTGVVTAGYVTGMVLIGLIFFSLGEGGDFIPIEYLGLLGLVPITIGVLALLQLFRTNENETVTGFESENDWKAIFFTVFMTQLGNGADSIITFSVFLAYSKDATDYLISATFLSMVFIFAGLAHYSLKHRKLSDFLDRYGRYLTPFILIFVGLYIFSDTASDLL